MVRDLDERRATRKLAVAVLVDAIRDLEIDPDEYPKLRVEKRRELQKAIEFFERRDDVRFWAEFVDLDVDAVLSRMRPMLEAARKRLENGR